MKIAIVGSGIGGLASASLLSTRHEVHVYEKMDRIGGRALSMNGIPENYKKMLAGFEMANAFSMPDIETISGMAKNTKIDLGFHLIGGGKRGACVSSLKRINANVNFIGSKLGIIEGDSTKYPMLSPYDKLKMLPRIMQLLFSRKETIEAMKKMSIEEAIEKYGKGKLKLVLEIFPRLITTVNELDKISTGESLFAQRELMGGHPVVYPAGGLEEISKAYAMHIEKNGGKIFLEREIKNVDVEDGMAKGIDGIEYDAVILNMPVQHIFRVVKEKHFEREWVRKIKSLYGTGSMVSYHLLNHVPSSLLGKSYVFLEKTDEFKGEAVAGMIDFKMAVPEAKISPPGKYLVQSYAICSPEEAKDRSKWEMLKSIIDENLDRLIKGYKKHAEWEIYNAIWHLDGVAKTIDNDKPDVETPIKNLYIAGDSVNSKGIGINCAVDSANIIYERIESISSG